MKDLSESLEDYLEAVFHIERDKGAARVKDVADRMGVKAPSVTAALRALSERGLINYAPYDLVTLTDPGRRIARGVVLRHRALKDFFVKVLSVDEAEADDAACKMEHVVSPTILDRLTRFILFVEECPLGGRKWLPEAASFCVKGGGRHDCEACIRDSLRNWQQDTKKS
ncbi:MAG: metal-dependent transcriptional regulator [Thermodesulfobacteriota bacterium]